MADSGEHVQTPPLQSGADAEETPSGAQLPPAKCWGAAHTKSRCEKQVADYLRLRGVPCFLPLIKRRNVGNRQVRFFSVPLFPGYVFFDLLAIERTAVFECRRVAQILAPPDPEKLRAELSVLARTLEADESLREVRYGVVGKPVRVVRGRLRDVIGEVVRLEGETRLVIRVDFIGRAACLSIDEALVEPLL